MELSRLLDELTLAANRVGIAVRMEAFDPHLSDARNPRGGLCTVLGRRVILVDANASLPDRIATVAAALARVDLESVFLPPIVRATIGAHARGARPRAAPPGEPVRLPTRHGKRGKASTLLPLARTKWRDS
ncbi:hypothetical protein [Sorangium sp. So ce385]|uniref:hypothetical protein n=1 Tax=Sorangium sp. So ce385 TaxID=3133308 RepID=UPI003F5B96AA